MDVDREICFCFHVSLRKLLQHLRVCQPTRASQLSECFGAGTGCGWCRPHLEQLFREASGTTPPVLPDLAQCQAARQEYLQRVGEEDGSRQAPTGEPRTSPGMTTKDSQDVKDP